MVKELIIPVGLASNSVSLTVLSSAENIKQNWVYKGSKKHSIIFREFFSAVAPVLIETAAT